MLIIFVAVAAATAAPADPAASSTYRYVVRQGDTMEGFAARYLVSATAISEVLRASGIERQRLLRVGEILTVPYAAMRWTPVDGRIASFRGSVRIGSTVAGVGSKVGNGAVVATAPDSFVAIRFPDASIATLPSNSTVRVVSLRRYLLTGTVDRRFIIERGESEWQVTPSRTRGDRFEVRTPVSVAAVRGTEFRVTFDDRGSRVGTGVVKGEVAFATPTARGSTALPLGFGAVSDNSGAVDKRVLLPPPDIGPASAVQRGAKLQFSIQPVTGAKEYLVEIARDAQFLDAVSRVRIDQPNADVEGVPDGSYFLRISAIDNVGLQGLPAMLPFQRELGEFTATPTGPSGTVQFRWTASRTDAASYRLIVSQREDIGNPIIDAPGLTSSDLIVGPLRPGTYYWRVVAYEKGSNVTSRIQKVTVTAE